MESLTTQRLRGMFDLLWDCFGPQKWWPAESPFEVMVGAVLTQNTSWNNVEKAIANLKTRGLLSPQDLQEISLSTLASEIRPAGYFNVKAKRLKNLVGFILDAYGGDLGAMMNADPGVLREGLLSVKGIGPETADSILLYAASIPVFVIDAYTFRILRRHAMADETVSYEDLQALFMDHLAKDPQLFNEFHALIVRIGKECCRRKPLCEQCPLKAWGPEDGPVSLGW